MVPRCPETLLTCVECQDRGYGHRPRTGWRPMEYRAVGLLRTVHLARDPLEHAFEALQASILLPRNTHSLLGHCHDDDGSCEKLWWLVGNENPSGCL
jgi:hypothetical protein